MPLPREKAWFPAKTYGWGWGIPLPWQGWVVMGVFIGAMIAGAPLAMKGPGMYVGYSFALAAVLVAVCYWKVEKPGRRLGRHE